MTSNDHKTDPSATPDDVKALRAQFMANVKDIDAKVEALYDTLRSFYLDQIVTHAESPGFARRLAEEEEACRGPVGEAFGVGNSGDPEQDAFWLAIDSVLFQGGEKQRSVVERIIHHNKRLAPVFREFLTQWSTSAPHEFFEVIDVSRSHGMLRSLSDGTQYFRVFGLLGEWEARRLRRGDYVFARLLAVMDGWAWFPSTPLAAFPEVDRPHIRTLAETLTLR